MQKPCCRSDIMKKSVNPVGVLVIRAVCAIKRPFDEHYTYNVCSSGQATIPAL